MTVEQIMTAIGCSEEQAREFIAHIAATPAVQVVESGTWNVTTTHGAHCDTCQRRTFHDEQGCCSCRPRPTRKARKTRKTSR